MKRMHINMSFDKLSLKNFSASRIIKTCVEAVLREEAVPVPCEINVLVTGDEAIKGINCAMRSIDKATDVLSFPMFDLTPGDSDIDWEAMVDPETGYCPLGDMAISIERAIAQANEFGHSVRREVGYLTIHSMLHLLGYDHLDEGPQKAQMRKREEEIAAKIDGMQRD